MTPELVTVAFESPSDRFVRIGWRSPKGHKG
jgi:hypothetical protein